MGFSNVNAIISFVKEISLPQEAQSPRLKCVRLAFDRARVEKTEAGYKLPFRLIVHVELSVMFPADERIAPVAAKTPRVELGKAYDMTFLISPEGDYQAAKATGMQTIRISDENNMPIPLYGGTVWRCGIDSNMIDFSIEKPGKYLFSLLLREHEAAKDELWIAQTVAVIEFVTEMPETNPCSVTVSG